VDYPKGKAHDQAKRNKDCRLDRRGIRPVGLGRGGRRIAAGRLAGRHVCLHRGGFLWGGGAGRKRILAVQIPLVGKTTPNGENVGAEPVSFLGVPRETTIE